MSVKVKKMTKRNSTKDFKVLSNKFNVHEIKKSDGTYRKIYAPKEDLMFENKKLLKIIEYSWKDKVSDYATGFKHKYDVIRNALIHRRNNVFYMLDIESFFDNITSETVKRYLNKYVASKTTFIKSTPNGNFKTLLQGVPTSPFISNVIMFDFDNHVGKIINKLGGTYTRYADDITISFKEDNGDDMQQTLIDLIQKSLDSKVVGSPLTIKESKTRKEIITQDKPAKVVGIYIHKTKTKGNNNWLATGRKYNEELIYLGRKVFSDIYKAKTNPDDVDKQLIKKFIGKLGWFLQVNRRKEKVYRNNINALRKMFNYYDPNHLIKYLTTFI